MSKVEDEINDMFEIQRLVIAKATLAGCRFVPKSTNKRIKVETAGWNAGRFRSEWRTFTVYECYLPDGALLVSPMRSTDGPITTLFEDVYSAALAALCVIEYEDKPAKPDDGSFALQPGNEQ